MEKCLLLLENCVVEDMERIMDSDEDSDDDDPFSIL